MIQAMIGWQRFERVFLISNFFWGGTSDSVIYSHGVALAE
jgi:hypothetical protein